MHYREILKTLEHDWNFFADSSTIRSKIKSLVYTPANFRCRDGVYYHFKGISEFALSVRAPKFVANKLKDLLPYNRLFLFDGKDHQESPVEELHHELCDVLVKYIKDHGIQMDISTSALAWEVIMMWAEDGLMLKDCV